MSDALLERQAKALEGILALLVKAPVLGLPTGGTKTETTKTATADDGAAAKKAAAETAKKAAADKAEAAKKAAAATAPKPPAGPPAGTKAPGGKRTVEQVREMIRKVANGVDRQSAKDILKDDGDGVEKVQDLKPQYYDAVYEACEVLLGGEGNPAAPAEPEDDFG